MIPRLVTAWTALVDDQVQRGDGAVPAGQPAYGLKLDEPGRDDRQRDLLFPAPSGTSRPVTGARSRRPVVPGDGRGGLIPLEQAQAPHEAETLLPVREHGTANALALWFSAELGPGISLSVGPGDRTDQHWGMTTGPAALPRAARARPAWSSAPKSEVRPGPAGR